MRWLLALFLAVSANAQQEQAFTLPPFTEGLHTRYSANVVPDNALVESLNIYLDEDVDGVVVTRKGRVKCNSTALTDTKSVRGVWEYTASDGSSYQVLNSSQSFFAHSNTCNPTEIAGLDSLDASLEFDCKEYLGKLWCTNGAVVFTWDGSSTSPVSGAPLGTLIDGFRNRIVISNINGSQSQVHFSGELDGTDWTTNSLSSSPVVISIGGTNDGDKITCLMGVYGDRYIVGKQNSLYGIYGFDQTDFAVRELSREVGCLEDRTVREKNNCLYWLSTRGVERLCGNTIERVSDPIRNQIDTLIASAGTARTHIDTTQTDYENGLLTAAGPGAPMNTTITEGSVQGSTFIFSTNGLHTTSWAMVDVDTTAYVTPWITNFDSDATLDEGDSSAFGETLSWEQYTSSAAARGGQFVSRHVHSGAQPDITYTQADSGLSTGTWSFVITSTVANTGGSRRLFRLYFSAPEDSDEFRSRVGTPAYLEVGWFIELYKTADTSQDYIQLDAATNGASAPYWTPIFTGLGFVLSDGERHYGKVTKSSGVITVSIDGSVVLSTDSAVNVPMSTHTFTALQMFGSETQIEEIRTPFFYEKQVSVSYDTGFSTPTWGRYDVAVASSSESSVTFKTEVSADNASWDNPVAVVDDQQVQSAAKRYIRHGIFPAPPTSTDLATVAYSALEAGTTGQFIAQCVDTSGMSSFDTFGCGFLNFDGSWAIAVATGSSCQDVQVATATWNAHTNNSSVVISTANYFGYRLTNSYSVFIATGNPQNYSCQLNWTEGASRPPAATEVYRDRYYLAYTSSTDSSAYNDHLLVLDKNDKWTLLDNIFCYSMDIYSRDLYCGSSKDDGFVYKLEKGPDDDGAAFVSRMRTKAYHMGSPETRKSFGSLYLDVEPEQTDDQSITLTGKFIVDRGTYTTTLGTVDLGEDPKRLLTVDFPFPLTDVTDGRYLQIELESNGTDQPWRLFGGRVYFTPLRRE